MFYKFMNIYIQNIFISLYVHIYTFIYRKVSVTKCIREMLRQIKNSAARFYFESLLC